MFERNPRGVDLRLQHQTHRVKVFYCENGPHDVFSYLVRHGKIANENIDSEIADFEVPVACLGAHIVVLNYCGVRRICFVARRHGQCCHLFHLPGDDTRSTLARQRVSLAQSHGRDSR